MLTLKDLSVEVEGKKILTNISLTLKKGEIHVLMGPNGAGKTTLAMGIIGNKNVKCQISNSKFQINGKNMFNLVTNERVRRGLFVSFQNPVEIEGLSVFSILRASYNSVYSNKKLSLSDFKKKLKLVLEKLRMEEDFLSRYVNFGFSGGEKKKFEIIQMLMLKPKFAILDEIDSGLDIDNLRNIAEIIKEEVEKERMGVLIISHSSKIFNHIKPKFVHVLINGRIKTFGAGILKKIEKEGYAKRLI